MEAISSSIKYVSTVGSSPIIFMMAGVVVFCLLARRDYLHTIFVILALCSGFYSTLLKELFKEVRPTSYTFNDFIPWSKVLKPEIYSFPSTHTVLYTVFFGYLFYLSYTFKGIDRLTRHAGRILSGCMIVLVGGSRVLLGVHYVRDVVAGYFFGLVYLGLLIAGERFLVKKLSGKPLKHKKR